MATFAVGDIHGHRDALVDLLARLTHVQADDTVVFLGDYIDRGPHSPDCIEAILAFCRDVTAHVVCLCGNHEDWMLQTMRDHRRHLWLTGMEAFDTIRSYSPDAERALREAIAAAGLSFYLRNRRSRTRLFSTVFQRPAELNADGWPRPRKVGRTIGIDTIAHGVLTAVQMPEGTIIQSRRFEAYPPWTS